MEKAMVNIMLPDGFIVLCEVALSPEAKKLGLAGMQSLDPGTGMLFMWDSNAPHSMWMRGMLFPIDIVWLDEHGKCVALHENVQPGDTSQYRHNSVYVLEMAAGCAQAHGLCAGAQVRM